MAGIPEEVKKSGGPGCLGSSASGAGTQGLDLGVVGSHPTLRVELAFKKDGQRAGGQGRRLEALQCGLTLAPPLFPAEVLYYTDDTAMARALVQSLLAKEAFDEVDMAHR